MSSCDRGRGEASAKERKKERTPLSRPTRAPTQAFSDYFAAVAATDILVPAVDVLACKPSELAFYPVPKLMIRRVGDHEAFSANRANEMGDGTAEARTVADALHYLHLFVHNAEPLVTMNTMIKNHLQYGAYDGCKTALKLAAP